MFSERLVNAIAVAADQQRIDHSLGPFRRTGRATTDLQLIEGKEAWQIASPHNPHRSTRQDLLHRVADAFDPGEHRVPRHRVSRRSQTEVGCCAAFEDEAHARIAPR